MQETTTCPVCQSINWQTTLIVSDHSISKEKFNIVRCLVCGLKITSPKPQNDKLPSYYQSENYISHSGRSNNFINHLYLLARKYSLNWKKTIINNIMPSGKILDIGCGTGEFLSVLKKASWDVSGIEPNFTARKKAELLLDQSIHTLLDEASGSFDIITLWHVLEHLPDLNESLQKIYKLLKPHSRILIAVPNHNSKDSIKYKEYWAGYDVPRHLWHFDKNSMKSILLKHGITIEKTIPMKLDAYYVSLLSEKYKNRGKTGIKTIFNGLINGFMSNMNAKESGEYSSLIFIAKK